MNYGSTPDRRTTLVQQQAAEIQSLRKQLTEARGGKPHPSDAAKPATGPAVEYRQSPEALVVLRNLLVEVENCTGPEKGEAAIPVSKALAEAMKKAAALVRKPKKP